MDLRVLGLTHSGPTLVLPQGDAVSGKLEGADPPALAKRVQELANERVSEKAAVGSALGVEPQLQAKLRKLIRCGGVPGEVKRSKNQRFTAKDRPTNP